MHLDADSFAKLELAIAEAYNAGGATTVGNLPNVTTRPGIASSSGSVSAIQRQRPGYESIHPRW